MKNYRSLTDIFTSTSHQRVLRVLAERPGMALYVREVSSLAEVSHGGASEALAQLAALGLITRQERGRLALYTADANHPLVRQFKILLNLTNVASLLDRLKLLTIEVFLFGSRAEGTDMLHSDIDLFVITDDKEAVYETLRESRLAGQIRPVVLTPLESIEVKEQDPLFYEQVMRGTSLWRRTDRDES